MQQWSSRRSKTPGYACGLKCEIKEWKSERRCDYEDNKLPFVMMMKGDDEGDLTLKRVPNIHREVHSTDKVMHTEKNDSWFFTEE